MPALTSQLPSHPSVDPHSNVSLLAWLMLVWALGVLALLTRLVHAQFRFLRIICGTRTRWTQPCQAWILTDCFTEFASGSTSESSKAQSFLRLWSRGYSDRR